MMLGKRKRIDPYAGTLGGEWPCYHCGRPARWRVNVNGIDGDGVNLCVNHASELLRQPGNEQLLEQALSRGLR